MEPQTGSETSSTDPMNGSSATSTSGTTSSTTSAPDDTLGPASTDATGSIFLNVPDGGGHPELECDMFAQDCPRGEKCVAWANDGGDVLNATKCIPVADEPAGPGEPCHVEGSAHSGVDDCELGAMCWPVDPNTLDGFCVPLCTGSEENPYCDEPGWECVITSDGPIVFCTFRCNPIEQDCPESQACYPGLDEWTCLFDASGDAGAYGDPCEFLNVCNPGLMCLVSSTVPPGQACENAPGCCTEVCDLTDPAGDQQCTGAPGGQICQPWYTEGTAPPGHENVGACALPR